MYNGSGLPLSCDSSCLLLSYGDSGLPLSCDSSCLPLSYGDSGLPLSCDSSCLSLCYGDSGLPLSYDNQTPGLTILKCLTSIQKILGSQFLAGPKFIRRLLFPRSLYTIEHVAMLASSPGSFPLFSRVWKEEMSLGTRLAAMAHELFAAVLFPSSYRVILKNMCVQFLECCFNPLMRVVRVCSV